MISTTQIFVSNWLTRFGIEHGFIGWPGPEDLTPEIVNWLDDETLSELYVALTYLSQDWKARKGHALAGELIYEIEKRDIRELETINRRDAIKRRPNRKANEYSYAAA
jgi:hypothetical protein